MSKALSVLNHYGIKYRQSGSDYMISCPNTSSHKNGDKNASCGLSDKGSSYGSVNCFSCGFKGNLVDFVAFKEGLNLQDNKQRASAIVETKKILGTYVDSYKSSDKSNNNFYGQRISSKNYKSKVDEVEQEEPFKPSFIVSDILDNSSYLAKPNAYLKKRGIEILPSNSLMVADRRIVYNEYLHPKTGEVIENYVSKGSLVVKAVNTQGNVCNLQYISRKNKKMFLPKEIKGQKHTLVGKYSKFFINKEDKRLFFVESAIDGLSLNQVGLNAIVCFNASNLKEVSKALKKKLNKSYQTIVFADNDKAGLEAGEEACRNLKETSNSSLLYSKKYKDVNEILVKEGREYLKQFIDKHLEKERPFVSAVESENTKELITLSKENSLDKNNSNDYKGDIVMNAIKEPYSFDKSLLNESNKEDFKQAFDIAIGGNEAMQEKMFQTQEQAKEYVMYFYSLDELLKDTSDNFYEDWNRYKRDNTEFNSFIEYAEAKPEEAYDDLLSYAVCELGKDGIENIIELNRLFVEDKEKGLEMSEVENKEVAQEKQQEQKSNNPFKRNAVILTGNVNGKGIEHHEESKRVSFSMNVSKYAGKDEKGENKYDNNWFNVSKFYKEKEEVKELLDIQEACKNGEKSPCITVKGSLNYFQSKTKDGKDYYGDNINALEVVKNDSFKPNFAKVELTGHLAKEPVFDTVQTKNGQEREVCYLNLITNEGKDFSITKNHSVSMFPSKEQKELIQSSFEKGTKVSLNASLNKDNNNNLRINLGKDNSMYKVQKNGASIGVITKDGEVLKQAR